MKKRISRQKTIKVKPDTHRLASTLADRHNLSIAALIGLLVNHAKDARVTITQEAAR